MTLHRWCVVPEVKRRRIAFILGVLSEPAPSDLPSHSTRTVFSKSAVKTPISLAVLIGVSCGISSSSRQVLWYEIKDFQQRFPLHSLHCNCDPSAPPPFSSVTSEELRPMKGKWLTLIFDACPTLFVGTVNKTWDKKKRELGVFSAQKKEYFLVS